MSDEPWMWEMRRKALDEETAAVRNLANEVNNYAALLAEWRDRLAEQERAFIALVEASGLELPETRPSTVH